MLGLAALLSVLSACGAEDSRSLAEISPASPEVWPGDSMRFVASVAGTSGESVEWGVVESGGGTIDATGTYTAPETEGTYTVVASFESLNITQSTEVRVRRNYRVSVSPTSATVAPGDSIGLTAKVAGDVKTVTWSIAQAPDGGTITAAGVYTAPQAGGTYDVIATSVADPSKTGQASITVAAQATAPSAPETVAVTISPSAASVEAGDTLQFTATVTGSSDGGVTWSVAEAEGGTVSATGLYTAPASAGTYRVVATSSADISKTSSATVTVAPTPTPTPTLTLTPTAASALPQTLAAFPGCQGAGCYTRGGFTASAGTPTIYRVTSLSNGTGAGTLGACIAASGPRVCTFAVAGTIHAPSTGYVITNPYITIRGDTAPGQGIAIDFDGVDGATASDVLRISTHDVVVRGLRFRHGKTYSSSGAGDSIRMQPRSTAGTGALNNVVIDHVSAHWGSDQVMSINSMVGMPTANYPHDITISYSIAAEGLSSYPTGAGSKCVMAVANTASSGPAMTNIDFHHNYFANCTRRFPETRLDGDVRLVNNVLYNWGNDRQSFQNGVNGDLINNLGRPGPNAADYPGYGSMFWVGYGDVLWTQTRAQTVHLAGNKYYGRSEQGWGTSIVSVSSKSSWGTPTQRATPLPAATRGPAIVAESADNLPTTVVGVGGAGHSRRLDCGGAWASSGVRDVVDTRLAAEFLNPPSYYPRAGCTGTSCWPKTVAETPTGSYPVLASISAVCSAGSRDNTSCACADSDSDGMPDYWERAFCGAASGTGSCSALDSTVAAPWTNIEAFQSGSVVAP